MQTVCKQPQRPTQIIEEPPKADPLEATIRKQVLDQMGKPINLYSVQVTNVGHQRYRANIRCSKSGSFEQTITDSFYLWVDEKGTIEKSNPEIEKKYHC